MTNLPHITNKQQDILRLIYRYRFIDRIQLQTFMHHQDRRRVGAWLKDLRENHYIEWIYDPDDFTNKTKHAIYYLGLNGIRWLREHEYYPPEELRKRYKESSRKPNYRARCLLIADCCLSLEAKTSGRTSYSFITASDYANPDSDYFFLGELRPQLCFVKETAQITTSYVLEIFDASTPRYMVKKRLKDYAQYLMGGEWETETGDPEPPIVLIACPRIAEVAYCKRRTRILLAAAIDYEEEPEDEDKPVHMRFATIEQVKQYGVTGSIWEEA